MTIDEARDLFGYSAWANGRMFDATAALPADQLSATIASSFSSVLGTLGHIIAAEWIWLRRWQGDSPAATPGWAAGSSLSELRTRLTEVESERDRLFGQLGDADLDRIVEYRRMSGEAHADRLSDLVRHAVNHSTYHRGQLVTQLRQIGAHPPGTDFVNYVRSRK
jgi:uncharacterized damage-inducible protein DinB